MKGKAPSIQRRSRLELTFEGQLRALQVAQPVLEHRFHPTRRWRFDFAWPDLRIAAEVEGGVWTRGRHTRGAGFTSDAEKYNTAAALGWTVLRFPPALVRNWEGARQVQRVIAQRKGVQEVQA